MMKIISCNKMGVVKFYAVILLISAYMAHLAYHDYRQPHRYMGKFSALNEGAGFTVCEKHGYFLSTFSREAAIQILNVETGRSVAVLGEPKHPGSDQSHFGGVFGVTCDENHGRILVSDFENKRIQIFDINTFYLIRSVYTDKPLSGMDVDHKHHRVIALVYYPKEFQILNDVTLQPSISSAGDLNSESEQDGVVAPRSMAIDERRGKLYVVDYERARVQVYDLETLAHVATINSVEQKEKDDARLSEPVNVAIDDEAGHVLVCDASGDRIQIFDADNLHYVATLSVHGVTPRGVIPYRGRLFIHETDPWSWFGRHFIGIYGPFVGNPQRQQ